MSPARDLRACDNQVYERLLDSATEETLVADMSSSDEYVKKFSDLRIQCENMLNPNADVSNVSVRSSVHTSSQSIASLATTRRKSKLPQNEFKTYVGNIRDWLSFWAQFRKIHEDSDIDNTDKIEYLIQSTVPGSRARQLVESFPVMGENYQKIVECMEARFGRQDLQIEVYVRELLRLVLRNTMTKHKLDISVLYDQIETQVRALDTLGITSDTFAAMLYPLIESCLPQDLLRIWQRSSFCSVSINTSNQSVPSDATWEIKLQNVMAFLRTEVESEQRICLASEGFGLEENVKAFKQKGTEDGIRKKISKHFFAMEVMSVVHVLKRRRCR